MTIPKLLKSITSCEISKDCHLEDKNLPASYLSFEYNILL